MHTGVDLYRMFASIGEKIKRATVVAAIALSFPATAVAFLTQPPPLVQAFSESDIVVLVRIETAKEEWVGDGVCGYRYKAEILQPFKMLPGNTESTHWSFDIHRELSPGETYILFLKYVSSYSEFYENNIPPNLQPKFPLEELIDVIRCNGITPGLDVYGTMAWKVVGHGVEIVGLPPESWPESIRMEGDAPWQFASKEDLIAYLEKLQ